ncbi:hypothetical protein [Streptomyces sp. NPDC047079]|uniref:hypothetical protein n=1 Tax=Streptomyces sp. NPDC047079 TaxID=3154607 RepID=UPI0033ED9D70
MVHGNVTRTPFKASFVGTWCAGLVFVAATHMLWLWLFGTDPDLRQQLVLVSLGCALVCVVTVALLQRSAGGWRPFGEVAAAVCVEAALETRGSTAESVSLPRTIPSRRGRQLRFLAWGIGIPTVLLGIVALAAGTPQRPELVQRIHRVGGEFGIARAEKVSDVRHKSSRGKDHYTATVVVRLPVGAGAQPVSTTVKPTTAEPLSPGDPVEVLYAPAQPRLGAVAGDDRSLGWKLRGETMPAYMRWFLVAASVLSWFLAVNYLSAKHGLRAFSRLGKNDKAIRGSYTRVGGHFDTAGEEQVLRGKYLEIGTDAGRLRFYTDMGRNGLPEAMTDRRLWLCWDAHRGARGSRLSPSTTPAALVFDTGLVVHGMMRVAETQLVNAGAVSVEKAASAPNEDRSLRLFDPRAQWPLYIQPLALQACVVVIACAALLTFDVATGWRWAAGIVGFLGACGAGGAVLDEGPHAKRTAA